MAVPQRGAGVDRQGGKSAAQTEGVCRKYLWLNTLDVHCLLLQLICVFTT